MSQERTAIREDVLMRWAASAMTLRAIADVHSRCAIPEAGSASDSIDKIYPRESFSQWAREGVRSALDHMLVWADVAIPIHDESPSQVTHEGFRWFYTLLRASLEGSAQSVWLTASSNSGEAVARLIRAVRDDLREQKLARRAAGLSLGSTEARIEIHASAAERWAEYGPTSDRIPSYVDLIRLAASRSELDPNECEATWRVASAAAHGKTWAILDLQNFVGRSIEWRPGQFHSPGIVNQDRLTASIDLSVRMLSAASVQLLLRNGFEPTTEFQRSVVAVARTTPMKDGGKQTEETASSLGIP